MTLGLAWLSAVSIDDDDTQPAREIAISIAKAMGFLFGMGMFISILPLPGGVAFRFRESLFGFDIVTCTVSAAAGVGAGAILSLQTTRITRPCHQPRPVSTLRPARMGTTAERRFTGFELLHQHCSMRWVSNQIGLSGNWLTTSAIRFAQLTIMPIIFLSVPE
jgi:hypothetical protein